MDAILTAATRIFVQHGYRGATTNRIAVAAGVSIGSLYEYFPGKEALLAALARRHMSEGFAAAARLLEGAAGPGSLEVLSRRGLEAMISLHERDPALHRVLFEETPLPAWLRSEVVAMSEPLVETLAALFAQRPEIRVPDPRLAARLVVQVTEALTHGFVLHPPPSVTRAAFVDEGARLLRAYLLGAG